MSESAQIMETELATVTVLPSSGMVTLRGDFADPAFAAIVTETVGMAPPTQRQIIHSDAISIGWMSPDELLILCPYEQADSLVAALSSALQTQFALVVNVSDARAMFAVEGSFAREVLAKLAPVDLAPVAFQTGELRRTRMAQVAAAFWMESVDSFRVICFRSVAQYLNDILTKSARAGSIVQHF